MGQIIYSVNKQVGFEINCYITKCKFASNQISRGAWNQYTNLNIPKFFHAYLLSENHVVGVLEPVAVTLNNGQGCNSDLGGVGMLHKGVGKQHFKINIILEG